MIHLAHSSGKKKERRKISLNGHPALEQRSGIRRRTVETRAYMSSELHVFRAYMPSELHGAFCPSAECAKAEAPPSFLPISAFLSSLLGEKKEKVAIPSGGLQNRKCTLGSGVETIMVHIAKPLCLPKRESLASWLARSR